MRKLLLSFTLLCFYCCASYYTDEDGNVIKLNKLQSAQYQLDEDGEKISGSKFQKKWREKSKGLARWDYVKKDSGRVAKLFKPVYATKFVDYDQFRKKLQILTGKKFDDDNNFLLMYTYENDFCSGLPTNNWTEEDIKSRKKFTTSRKNTTEEKNKKIIILNFFEEGIILKNEPHSPEEYYFTDKGNFLRKNIFLHPTLCGSYALVKPNGQILVRNGEYGMDAMEQHLKPENWNLFFPPSE